MKRITAVEALSGQRLKLHFDDGVTGVVDLAGEADKEIFSAWRDPMFFGLVRLAHGGRSIEWPGEIDLCADALYLEVTGKSVDELFPNWQEMTNA